MKTRSKRKASEETEKPAKKAKAPVAKKEKPGAPVSKPKQEKKKKQARQTVCMVCTNEYHGDFCPYCAAMANKFKEAKAPCERCSKIGAVFELGHWICLACAKRCKECTKPVVRGVLRNSEWLCDDCHSKIVAAKWAAGSQSRKEDMELWDCPQALGGHKWDGPAGTKVQDMKCIWCGVDHPGKKHPKCDFCNGLIADHSEAFWKGAKAFCCRACRNGKGPVCATCKHCCSCTGSCGVCSEIPKKKEAKKDHKYCEKYCEADNFQTKAPEKPKCDRCNDTIQGEVKKSDVKGKHFCCEACERVYRATHVSPGRTGTVECGCCEKRVKYQESHKDGDIPGKYFCDIKCADKYFEREIAPATDKRKKKLGINKETCDACGLEFLGRDLVDYKDKHGKARLCKDCNEEEDDAMPEGTKCKGCKKEITKRYTMLDSDYYCSERCFPPEQDELDYRGEPHEVVRRYTTEKSGVLWTFRLVSSEYDDFKHIAGAEWGGRWKESDPMQSSFSIQPDRGPAAEQELQKMGYICKDKKLDIPDEDCDFVDGSPSQRCGEKRLKDSKFCDIHKKYIDAGAEEESARVKYTQVECDFCNKKFDSAKAAKHLNFPKELFCSEDCADERDCQVKKQRSLASGKTQYRLH